MLLNPRTQGDADYSELAIGDAESALFEALSDTSTDEFTAPQDSNPLQEGDTATEDPRCDEEGKAESPEDSVDFDHEEAASVKDVVMDESGSVHKRQ